MSEQMLEQIKAGRKLAVATHAAQQNVDRSFAVTIYATHVEAGAAVRELERSGFDMQKLSFIGKDYHSDERVIGCTAAGNRMNARCGIEAFWGGLWGLLFGSIISDIQGIGPVIMAGPLVVAIFHELECAAFVGGVSALGAALISVGIPRNIAMACDREFEAGRFVMIVHGTQEETTRARIILQMHTAPAA